MRIKVVLSALVLFLEAITHNASATPPDILTSDIIMMGASADRAVFLVATGFNLGSHYLWETKWFLLAMDLHDLSFEWVSLGGMMAAEEDFGGTVFYSSDEPVSIPGVLSNWNVEYELRFDGSLGYSADSYPQEYYIREGCLCVNTGSGEFRFSSVNCFDPSTLAVLGSEFEEYFIPNDSSVITDVIRLDELSRFFWNEVDSLPLAPQAAAEFGELYLLVTVVADDVIPFDVIFTLPMEEQLEARDIYIEYRESLDVE